MMKKMGIVEMIYILFFSMWNYAFIDGQNLYRWIQEIDNEETWKLDLKKFRTYLYEKYHIRKAYYFIGYSQNINQDLYTFLQECGFIICFKKQNKVMETHKKGNIDSDLIFTVMQKLIDEADQFDKILLVSWDGDFKILVDFLIKKERFLKILFPNKKYASSLYKSLPPSLYDYLSNLKSKIQLEDQ